MQKTLERGILIAVEGIDGSGKTTLARTLFEELERRGLPTLLTKEPGGTPLGQKIRTIVQERDVPIGAHAEYLLFAADRAQHAEQVILPHLRKKYLIISDRLGDSSLVYQGYGRGLDLSTIGRINEWALQGVRADRTLYVHVDVDTALNRVQERAKKISSFEQEPRQFFTKLVDGFEQLYARRTDVCRLDSTQPPDLVAQHALEDVLEYLERNGLWK